MRRLILLLAALAALLAFPTTASATWSIIAADRATGRLVIASATCADVTAIFLNHLQAVIVPDKGVAAAQARIDVSHKDQNFIVEELAKGTDPAAIVAALSKTPGYADRQFGIVDLTGRAAGGSGAEVPDEKSEFQGQAPGTQITYAIQGNTLRPGVTAAARDAFVNARGALTDRVMAAMDAADRAGGDKRCSCPPGEVCDGAVSSLAYIGLVEKGARPGQYAMLIPVARLAGSGPEWIDAAKGESQNPVKTLRMRYDAWRKTRPADFR